MVEPIVLARAEELSLQIDHLHVSYLEADESPHKIEQRTKLENFIRKYLCLVAHGRKFIFRETAEILRCSVEMKSNFSAYRASTAWNAIARYAANLVAQPWRKEFRIIKTFSGFYMHDIEENLVGADRLLDCMGYKRVDHSSLVLEQPIDVDAVISVSRDAIVAFVECQMMKEIWEGVYPQFECSWREIMNFRESHVCSPENAIKNLTFLYHQSCFHQQQMLASGVSHDPYSSSSCMYGQTISPQMSVPYYGYSPYSSVPPQPRYACVVNPQQMMGYPLSPGSYHHNVKSPVQLLPSNGYHYSHPASSGHNGYTIAQSAASMQQNYNCVVPTGQLIELDSGSSTPSSRPPRISVEEMKMSESRNGNIGATGDRVGYLNSDGGVLKRDSPPSARSVVKSTRPNTLEDLKPRRNGVHVDHMGSTAADDSYSHVDKHGVGKQVHRQGAKKSGTNVAPMQDGTGTWESWDYVYRNLESQGYNKDVGERGDILHSSTFPRRGSVGSAGSSPNVNSTIVRNSRNVREAEFLAAMNKTSHLSQVGDGIQSMRLNCEDSSNGRGVDAVDSRVGIQDAKPSQIKEKIGTKSTNSAIKNIARDDRREMDNSSLVSKKSRDQSTQDSSKNIWECVYCTYHNKSERFVCDMCGKSHKLGNEDKPLISGGRECPKCTLVNARGVVSCAACGESLKNSPTYI